jgi:DNA-binding winged helix-turn-helix (wHTH) protein/tetratricopeptide (TPR) repeat protein
MGIDKVALTGCEIDLVVGRCIRGETAQTLSSTEARLIAYFVDNPRRDIPRGELLAAVFGYSETVRSRTVDTTIQRLRKKVEEDPANPNHILTVHGIGYRFEPFSVALPSFFPSQLSEDQPGVSDKFFGRQDVRDEVLRHFDAGAPIVSIVGAGGMGKTRFARWLGMAVTDRWTCTHVDVSRARTAEAVVHATIAALHSRAPADEDPSMVIGRILERCPMMIVLDGFEHVVEDAEAVSQWLTPTSESRLLVTSRVPLGIPNETVIALGPLSARHAAALFLARVRAVDPTIAGSLDLSRLRDVVERLDCMPLAIEIAAAQARTTAPEALLDRIEQGMILAANSADSGETNALASAIQWSWDQLTVHEQTVLTQATVFRGHLDLPSAEAVLQLPPDAPPVLDVLESLLDQSLMTTEPGTHGVRLKLLETVRDFATLKADAAAMAAARDAHSAYFLAQGERWMRASCLGDTGAHSQLVSHFENIGQTVALGTPLTRLRAMICQAPVFLARGMSRRQVSRFQAAIGDAEPVPQAVLPWAMRALADYLLAVGRRAEAGAAFERGIEAAGDDLTARLPLQAFSAWLAMTSGDKTVAVRFQSIVDESAQAGLEVHAVLARLGLAAVALRALRLDEAEVHATRVAVLLTEMGLGLYMIDALKVLAYVAEIRGDRKAAVAQYSAIIANVESVEHPASLAVQLGAFARSLVSLSDEQDDLAQAGQLLARARDIEATIGARIPTTNNIQAEAMLLWEAGDLRDASELVQRRLDSTKTYGPMGTDGDLVGMIADLSLDEGDPHAALQLLDEAAELPVTRMATALAHSSRAVALARLGRVEESRDSLGLADADARTPILRAVNELARATVDVLGADNPAAKQAAVVAADALLKRVGSQKTKSWFYVRRAADRLAAVL